VCQSRVLGCSINDKVNLLYKDWKVWWYHVGGVLVGVLLFSAVKDVSPNNTNDLGVEPIAVNFVLAAPG